MARLLVVLLFMRSFTYLIGFDCSFFLLTLELRDRAKQNFCEKLNGIENEKKVCK